MSLLGSRMIAGKPRSQRPPRPLTLQPSACGATRTYVPRLARAGQSSNLEVPQYFGYNRGFLTRAAAT